MVSTDLQFLAVVCYFESETVVRQHFERGYSTLGLEISLKIHFPLYWQKMSLPDHTNQVRRTLPIYKMGLLKQSRARWKWRTAFKSICAVHFPKWVDRNGPQRSAQKITWWKYCEVTKLHSDKSDNIKRLPRWVASYKQRLRFRWSFTTSTMSTFFNEGKWQKFKIFTERRWKNFF